MIPKVIHYIWLGDKEMPATDKAFVEGWRKLLPDWQFRQWNLESIKGLNNLFLRETLAARKWVFACDWLRLYALATEGGFYIGSSMVQEMRDSKGTGTSHKSTSCSRGTGISRRLSRFQVGTSWRCWTLTRYVRISEPERAHLWSISQESATDFAWRSPHS